MNRVSQKAVFNAVFCVLVVITLNVCVMEPMTLDKFLEDPIVQGIIKDSMKHVNLVQGSEGEEGNEQITDLVAGKYYKIDECDFDGVDTTITDTKFVTASGALAVGGLTGIGRLNGTTIKGLINDQYYYVKSAVPFPSTVPVTLYDQASPPPLSVTGTSPPNVSGVLTLSAPTDDYYLELPSIGTIPINLYQIVRSPYPSGAASNVLPLISGNIIALEGAGTKNDYVFLDAAKERFYFLTVIINPVPPSVGDLTITIVPYINPIGKTFDFGGSSTVSHSQNDVIEGTALATLNVTVNTADFDANTVKWQYGGLDITIANVLTETETNAAGIDFTVAGSYEFTVYGEINGEPYSGTYTITITQ